MTQALINNLNNITQENPYKIKITHDAKDFQKVFDSKNKTKEDTSAKNEGYRLNDKSGDDTKVNIKQAKASAGDKTDKNNSSEKADEKDLKDFSAKVQATEESVDELSSEVVLTEKKENDIDIVADITNDEDSKMENEFTPLTDTSSVSAVLTQLQPIVQRSDSETEEVINQQEPLNKTTDSLQKFADVKLNSQAKTDVKLSDIDKQSAKTERETIQEIISDEMAEELNIEALDAGDADTGAGSDLMQKQSPQEYSMKAMIQGDVKFEDVNLKVVSPQNVKVGQEISPEKIIEQITKQMEGMHNNSKVNIVLNPESLGRLTLQLINSKDGLTAHFTVMTQEAKDLIMKGLDGLKQSLLAQGVSVDNLVVKMSEDANIGDSEHQFKWGEGSRGGNKEQSRKNQEKDEKPFEQMMFEINQNGKV